jgi:hypothetical protein
LLTNISQYFKLTNSPFEQFWEQNHLPQQTPPFCHKLTKYFKFPETLNKNIKAYVEQKQKNINKIHDQPMKELHVITQDHEEQKLPLKIRPNNQQEPFSKKKFSPSKVKKTHKMHTSKTHVFT